MRVGREDGVEDFLDHAVARDEREPPEQRHARDVEGRQAQRPREGEVLVAEQFEREVQALDDLALIVGRLSAEAEDGGGAGGEQVAVVIAEAAALGRAAAGDATPGRPVFG